MIPLDRGISNSSALVVEGNPTSRSILASQLREIGVGQVVQCSRLSDARRQLETRQFDIVLCELHFPGQSETGQDMLDELRRAGLLPFSTVFIMISAEARYDKIAEAAESALDSYLLKPHKATTLVERIQQARHRKRVLAGIFEAIENGQYRQAATLCFQRFAQRGEFWMYAGRVGAELLLRLGQQGPARTLLEAIIEAKPQPWARLGLARSWLDAGQHARAMPILQSLLVDAPDYADAHDVLGILHHEQGRHAEALDAFRNAARLTPGSIVRLQRLGRVAFQLGAWDEAAVALERATTLGYGSKMFDPHALVLLALIRLGERDTKALQRCDERLRSLHEKSPDDPRLTTLATLARLGSQALARQPQAVADGLASLAANFGSPEFDFDAACAVVSLLSMLEGSGAAPADASAWVETLALRFCTSRAVTDVLALNAAGHADHKARIEAAHHRVFEIAEKALSHSLAGDPRRAVVELLTQGEATANAKLVDSAGLVLQRYRSTIDHADELDAVVAELRQRLGRPMTVPTLGVDLGRPAGGLTLRVAPPPLAAASPSTGGA